MTPIAESWDRVQLHTRRTLLRTGLYIEGEVLDLAKIEWKHLSKGDKVEIAFLYDRVLWLVEDFT